MLAVGVVPPEEGQSLSTWVLGIGDSQWWLFSHAPELLEQLVCPYLVVLPGVLPSGEAHGGSQDPY